MCDQWFMRYFVRKPYYGIGWCDLENEVKVTKMWGGQDMVPSNKQAKFELAVTSGVGDIDPDRRAEGQAENSIPPNFVCGRYNYKT